MSQKSDVQPDNTAFGRGSYRESVRIADILRTESVGGSILLIATVLAIIFANTPLYPISCPLSPIPYLPTQILFFNNYFLSLRHIYFQ